MWVGSSSTSFTPQALSCEYARYRGKPVIANPTMISLTGACNPGPGNHCIGVPCSAIPNCKPVLPNLRKWTLDPLLLYALSVNTRTHRLPDPLRYSSCFCQAHSITSIMSNGVTAMATSGSSLPHRVTAQLCALPTLKLLHKASCCETQRTCVGSETEAPTYRSRWAHERDSYLW